MSEEPATRVEVLEAALAAEEAVSAKLRAEGNRMRNGDDPDTIIVTYGRCNAAAELTAELMRVAPPANWRNLATNMLNRDLLVDHDWWRRLITRKNTRLNLGEIKKMPSASTCVTAGHQLAIAAAAFEQFFAKGIDGDEDLMGTAVDRSARDDNPPGGGWTWRDACVRVWEVSEWQCEAHGLHHELCPGKATPETADQFAVHHVFPREQAKRYGIPPEKYDVPSNAILVWNRYPRGGASGCHGRIHSEMISARSFGLLSEKGATLP